MCVLIRKFPRYCHLIDIVIALLLIATLGDHGEDVFHVYLLSFSPASLSLASMSLSLSSLSLSPLSSSSLLSLSFYFLPLSLSF